MPEKALRLSGPSLEIVERCDGIRTVQEIISELQSLYSTAEPQKVEDDILGYLARLRDERALDFTSEQADRSAGATCLPRPRRRLRSSPNSPIGARCIASIARTRLN